jgi:hypothetical protein
MTTTTEPTIDFNKTTRTIKADYLVGTDTGGTRGGERRIYASFRVTYDKGGPSMFSGRVTPRSYTASIARETEEDAILDGRKIGNIRGFRLFEGLMLLRSDPVGRYSEKGLRAFFDEALAHLETVREDPRVAKYFATEEVPA